MRLARVPAEGGVAAEARQHPAHGRPLGGGVRVEVRLELDVGEEVVATHLAREGPRPGCSLKALAVPAQRARLSDK